MTGDDAENRDAQGRAAALAAAGQWFDEGGLLEDLRRRVAYRTESERAERRPELYAYLEREISPTLARLGFASVIVDNAIAGGGPFLIAERHEGEDLPTALLYGHGDVVDGHEGRWRDGLSPWSVTVEGDRWYGRGTADNKGQHSILFGALAAVLAVRGRAGCNIKVLIEMGEEAGSPGLAQLCRSHGDRLAADVLIGCDGPRLGADTPSLFLGSRGALNIDLAVTARDRAHHSGNWGGLLANPGTILANAIACLVDGQGRIQVPALRPPPIPASIRRCLAAIRPGGGAGDPAIDAGWGEPGLTEAERLFAWNTIEVLSFITGNPDHPINAIPPRAWARLGFRFVVGTNEGGTGEDGIVTAIRAHLDAHGFGRVEVTPADDDVLPATRLDPEAPPARWAAQSMARTLGHAPAVIPNFGSVLPNHCFARLLGMPTLWLPHSYPGCCQHAPDEHLLAPVAREGLLMTTGLLWDLLSFRA